MYYGHDEVKKLSQEALLDVAMHIVHAVQKAPQITGHLEVKTAVVTGEELLPIIELLEEVGEDEMVLWMDGMSYRTAYEEGNPPVLLLLGADLSKSKSNWDCGACGFPTCGEFNRYSKLHYGMGLSSFGPSCMLNALDFGIASDWACAAASKYDIENRIHVSIGLCGLYLAYIDDVSSIIGLSIGPVKEFWYYNRPIWTRKYDKEFNRTFFLEIMRTQYPSMFQTFAGNAHPPIKDYDKWWDKDAQDFVKIDADPEINAVKDGLVGKIMSIVPDKRARVEEFKARAKEEGRA